MKNNKESLNFVYIGPALDEGEINASDLGAALVALGSLFHCTNKLINDDHTSLDVKVKALRKGSFCIDLLCDQTILEKAVSFLNGNEITAVTTLFSLLGIGTSSALGLFKLIKHINNRKIINKTSDDISSTTIELEDGVKFTVLTPVLKLYLDPSIRTAIEQIVKPLEKDGIESLEIRSGEVSNFTIKKEDFSLFEYTPNKENLGEVTSTIWVTLETINFKQGKWKINDGNKSFFASMKDTDYLKKIEKGEVSFLKNDMLQIKLKMIQSFSDVGLKTIYEIVEVHDHKNGHRQLVF